ncbi:MAG: DUF5723 family protein [Bacteroidales bacterium]|nr:DUF5723 family protein [Bacteroidales bacterium]
MKHSAKHTFVSLCVVLAFSISSLPLKAQNSTLLFSSDILPHGNVMNPAFFPNTPFYLALPSATLNMALPLAYSDIIQYDAANQVTNINLNNITNQLMEGNTFTINPDIYAVGLGLKIGKTFVTLSSQVKTHIAINPPTGLLTFLNEGNMNHLGAGNEVYITDGNILHVSSYAEVGLGLGRTFALPMGDLTVGARVKLIDGIADIHTTNTFARIYTSEDLSTMRADVNYQLGAAGMFPISLDTAGNFIIGNPQLPPTNYSVGFDLGARWQWEKLDVAFSILDLGSRINWDQNVVKLIPESGNGAGFTFEGIDLNGVIQNGTLDSTFTQQLSDSLSALMNYTMVDGESYWTSTPTRINLSAFYRPLPLLKVGAIFHGELDRGVNSYNLTTEEVVSTFRQNITLMANLNLMNWIEVMVGNSVVSDGLRTTVINPSVGVTLSPFKTLQAYFMLDYISNIYLVDAKSAKLTAGVSLAIPGKRPDKD